MARTQKAAPAKPELGTPTRERRLTISLGAKTISLGSLRKLVQETGDFRDDAAVRFVLGNDSLGPFPERVTSIVVTEDER